MTRLGHIRLLLYNVEVSVWRLRTYKKPVCVWYIPCILLVYPLYTFSISFIYFLSNSCIRRCFR